MEIRKEDLERKYSCLSDDELIALNKSNGLSDVAYSALKNELLKRNLTADKITEIETNVIIERKKDLKKNAIYGPPKIWIGFVFAALFFAGEIIEIGFDFKGKFGPITTPAGVLGFLYWLFCVQRYHQIVNSISDGEYPISPAKAVAFHFIPIFNLYWIFKWPIELAGFMNNELKIDLMNGFFIGLSLLICFFINRIDGAIGLMCLFFIGLYLNNKLKKHPKIIDNITQQG